MADFDPYAHLDTDDSGKPFDPYAHLDSDDSQKSTKTSATKYDPTEGMTAVDKFLAGAGKAFVDTGRGLKQIYNNVADKVDPRPQTLSGLVTGANNSRSAESLRDIQDSRQLDAPLMNTGAGTVGNIVGQAAPLFATGGTGIVPAIAGSAAMSAVQPVGDGESRTSNTVGGAIGGGVGFGVGKVAGKVFQPFKNALSDTMAQHIETLRNAGVPLDLAQSTGSKGAQTLKNAVADNPIVGGSAMPEAQKAAFNKAVLSQIGETGATKADQATLGSAKSRIGKVFDDVAERNPIKFDDTLQHELTQVHAGATGELSEGQMKPINNQINTILDKAADGNGAIDGKAYQNIKSSLDRISMGSDQGQAHWARQVRTALDNGLQRSASPEDLDSLMTARKQYGNMKKIEGSVDDNDDISPAKLATAIDTRSNASTTVYGKGDQSLYRLAVAGKNVISNTKTANSGTAQRLAGMAAIGGGADALVDRDEHGNIKYGDVAKYAAMGAAAPAIARAVVENPRAVNLLSGLGKSKIASGAAQATAKAGQIAGTEYGEKSLAK